MIRILKQNKAFIFGLVLSLFSSSFLMSVSAQGGGALALNLSPDTGAAGTFVTVTCNVPAYLSSRGLDAGWVTQYKGLLFALVWDINNSSLPVDLETVRTAEWQIMGSAQFDQEGMLSGAVTIPHDAKDGDHLIYAIYNDRSSEGPLTYFWGTFTVVSAGTLNEFLPLWLVALIIAVFGIAVAVALAVYFVRRRRSHEE